MKNSLVALLVAIAATGLACGSSSDSSKDSKSSGDDDDSGDDTSSGDDDTAGDDDDSSSATINGEKPADYYGKLTYEQVGAALQGVSSLSETSGKNDAFELNVYLLEDKSFVVYYAEGVASGPSLTPDEAALKKIEGTWKIEKSGVLLGDAFTCTGVVFNKEPTMACVVNSKIISAGAVGRGPTLLPGAKKAPDDAAFWELFE